MIIYSCHIYKYIIMQSLKSISADDSPNIKNEVVKLERVLRLFRCIKKNDHSDVDEIRKQCSKILLRIQSLCPDIYEEIESKILKEVEDSLSLEEEKPKAKKKVQTKKGASSSFGSLNQSQSMQENMKSIQDNGIFAFSKQESSIQPNSESSLMMSSNRLMSNEIIVSKEESESLPSVNESETFRIKEYYLKYEPNFQSKLSFNEDLLMELIQKPDTKVHLMGVQKPTSMKTEKLYFCATMEFMMEDVLELKNIQKKFFYNDQINAFENASRIPFALVVKGTNITDLKMQYVKFLLEFKSPCPIVIILNSESLENSIVVRMSEKAIKTIEETEPFNIQKLNEIYIKNVNLYKKSQLSTIQKSNSRNYATKYLKNESNLKIQNRQAIKVLNTPYIEDPSKIVVEQKSENISSIQNEISKESNFISEDISQLMIEKKQVKKEYVFKYKLHSKFGTNTPKENFYFYSVDEENQLIERTKLPNLKEADKYINEHEGEIILGLNISTDEKKNGINPESLFYLWSYRNRSPIFILRLKAVKGNQIFFGYFNENLTEEMIKEKKIMFEELDECENGIIKKLIQVTNQTSKMYETKVNVKEYNV